MAARKQLWHPDEVRAKIQASQLINRLHNHAFGKVELSPTQVRSIEILLKKGVPDLSSVTLQGDAENPVNLYHRYERHIVDSKATDA
jgi:hypothetical protein